MEFIMKICFVSLYVLLLFVICETYSQCKVPNGDAGTCMAIAKCKTINDLNKKIPKTDEERLFIRQSSCGVGEKIKVCCPHQSIIQVNPVIFPNSILDRVQESKTPAAVPLSVSPASSGVNFDRNILETRVLPSQLLKPGVCGVDSSSSNKITGGGPTAIDAYPWLALLEYPGEFLGCGGSLISSKFVLTAAHCLDSIHGKPIIVRLSEYNTTSYPTDTVEVEGGGFEDITVSMIPVNSVFKHPDFNRAQKIHDIGLVKMEYAVKYSDFIKPICLPQVNYMGEFTTGTNFTVAGWGTDNGKKNEVKMEVVVPFVPTNDCKIVHDTVNDYQICAGGVEGKDSCDGDSGGPLMYEKTYKNHQYYYAAGVVSFGAQRCGTPGNPAVYTNVFLYLSWINQVLSAN